MSLWTGFIRWRSHLVLVEWVYPMRAQPVLVDRVYQMRAQFVLVDRVYEMRARLVLVDWVYKRESPSCTCGVSLLAESPTCPCGVGLSDESPTCPCRLGLSDESPTCPCGLRLLEGEPILSLWTGFIRWRAQFFLVNLSEYARWRPGATNGKFIHVLAIPGSSDGNKLFPVPAAHGLIYHIAYLFLSPQKLPVHSMTVLGIFLIGQDKTEYRFHRGQYKYPSLAWRWKMFSG